ncbi:MAG: hypothetical protein Q9217_003529 [Psora testacea]
MDNNQTALLLAYANSIYHPKAEGNTRPPAYKAVGISLAIASGVFIGISFVLKKMGLLRANVKYNEEAGEGYGYLKNAFWWTGMTLMIIGEICNFVAYAFVDAILVTPLGALSVVITTILSAIFLKERLSFVGKIGCFMCIIGSVVIVMNAPEQSAASTIQDMKRYVLAPGFLSYAGVIILGCTFVALWVGPRYGKKSMLVYLTVCSLTGGLSVVATQGLGAAVVTQASGISQFNQWFLYVLFVFVIATLVTEIIYLNKALNLFNAALVTPTYYVYFTSSTIITSAILFQGFKGTPTSIVTVVMGFFVICSGVVLLQLSKSAKDVPDTAIFRGDLDQVRTVAEQEEPESEPKADAIRGTAAIIRRISQSRQKMEAAEAKRVHEDRMRDQMEPIGENEQVEWDGLRRRKTVLDGPSSISRQKTLHPPLGMTHFPDDSEDADFRPASTDVHGGGVFHGRLFDSFRRKKQHHDSLPAHSYTLRTPSTTDATDRPRQPLTEVVVSPQGNVDTSYLPPSADGAMEMGHVHGLPGGLQRSPSSAEHQHNRPIAWAHNVNERPSASQGSSSSLAAPGPLPHQHTKRQFSFQNVFHRNRGSTVSSTEGAAEQHRPSSRLGLGSRQGSKERVVPGFKAATEEERLGLVTGDSNAMLPSPEYSDRDEEEDDWDLEGKRPLASVGTETGTGTGTGTISIPLIREEKEAESRRESPERAARIQAQNLPTIVYPDDSRGGSRSGGAGPAFI